MIKTTSCSVLSDHSFPLQLSRFVKDIQRRNPPFLNVQNTIADAVIWMKRFSVRSIPIASDTSNHRTLARIMMIDANRFLETLLEMMNDNSAFLGDFFAVPLSAFWSKARHTLVSHLDMDLVTLVRRLYHENKDMMLVSEGICIVGLITPGDIFDVMIGTAVLDNALFNTCFSETVNSPEIKAMRVFCLKQKISTLFETLPEYSLNIDNAILSAARLLRNPSTDCILVSNHDNAFQDVTPVHLLSALLGRFQQCISGDRLRVEMMQPLKTLIEMEPLNLTPDSTVFETVQAIHFNNLSSAVIQSPHSMPQGIIKTNTLFKAFLDSMDVTTQSRSAAVTAFRSRAITMA